MTHVHLTEPDLVERALAGLEPPDCTECRTRALEIGGFLDRCRDGLHAAEEPADAFVDQVLARTTREDLRWRGDWRLVRGFVRGRLRSSRMLRFAAASLILHMLALPVFAWMALREARRDYAIQVSIQEQVEQTLPKGPMEPDPVIEAPALPPEPGLIELGELGEPGQPGDAGDPEGAPTRTRARSPAEVARIVNRDQVVLRGSVAPPTPLGPPGSGESTLARLFEARARVLAGELPGDLPAAQTGLERAVLAEVMLDDWLLGGREDPDLGAVLGALGSDPTVPEAERRLELFSLQRAFDYGLLGGPGLRRLDALSVEVEPVTVRVGDTNWAAWSAALEAALRERPPADREAAGDWTRWDAR